ncbi:MAG TPA: glycosyltransferase [Fimbriimonadaceae bacterium]|nr:glycosyltransferase [Fimbriimonadaceae bacterium]
MKIAFFTEGYDPYTNGVVVLVKAYREALLRAGHEVVVFAPEHNERPLREEGVIRLPSMIWSRKAYPCLRPFSGAEKHFKKAGFDIVHSHHSLSSGTAAERVAKKFGLPHVYTFHTMLPSYSKYLPLMRPVSERGLLAIVRRHCRKSDCVTVSTHLMAQWLRERKIETPIALVRPPLSVQEPSPDAYRSVRARHKIPLDVPLILCASRLSPEKDVDFLLRSVALIPRHTPFRLLIAGGGAYEERLRAEMRALGLSSITTFAGWVPHEQMPDYFAASDLVAFPSRNDTLGLVLVEAMAASIPAVAVASNGPLEVVRDGITGYLTPFDEQAFAAALYRLLANPELRKGLGREAKLWSHEFCTSDAAAQLEEAYAMAREEQPRRAKREAERKRRWQTV